MQEEIYVRTTFLDKEHLIRLATDIRNWIYKSEVYVQMCPARIVVCYAGCCTVINEGDKFSFMQRASGRIHYIINHTEKELGERI